jgi:microcompartment protein PduM
VAKLDHIIEQVLAKIKQREHQSYEVDYHNQGLPPDEQVYTEYGNIAINDVTIELLLELYRVNVNDPWTRWILQGISFQENFTFHISQYMIKFIPKKMLLDWPVTFVVDKEHPVFSFYQKSVSRQDLAAIPDQSIVVVTPTQKLTTEAKEVSQYKQLTIKIRTDEDCIWQK